MLRPGLLYFAYGSNMDPEFLVEVLGTPLDQGWPARADGWLLAFNLSDESAGFGIVANLVEAEGCCVHGVVYRLPHQALQALDVFEGVPKHYRRSTLWVVPRGRPARQAALVYLGQPRFTVPEGRPQPRYMELLVRGAETHGLPPDYVSWLRAVAAGKPVGCFAASEGRP